MDLTLKYQRARLILATRAKMRKKRRKIRRTRRKSRQLMGRKAWKIKAVEEQLVPREKKKTIRKKAPALSSKRSHRLTRVIQRRAKKCNSKR